MALDLTHLAIMTAAKMCVPVLVTSIVVGVLVNILQTVTSIRDMSLTFVPKLLAAGVVLSLSLPWTMQTMTAFFQSMYSMFGRVTP